MTISFTRTSSAHAGPAGKKTVSAKNAATAPGRENAFFVLEIYLNGGETVLSTRYFQEADALELKVDCMAGSALAYEMDTLSIDYLVDR